MFHTSIMFRSGLLADQSSTWMLRSCSHVLTFFVCRSQILLKNHVFIAIQMPYRSSMDERRWLSNTSIYTVWCICNCWFEEDNIAHTSCWYTTPHYYRSWEFHGPLQTSRIVALIFSSPNQSSSITKFDAQLGLVAKNDFWALLRRPIFVRLCACLLTKAALTSACG